MCSEAIFDLTAKRERIAALESRMGEPSFWESGDAARDTIAEANELKSWVQPWEQLKAKTAELQELADLLEMEADASLEADLVNEITKLEQETERLEVRTMLRGDDDTRDALLTI